MFKTTPDPWFFFGWQGCQYDPMQAAVYFRAYAEYLRSEGHTDQAGKVDQFLIAWVANADRFQAEHMREADTLIYRWQWVAGDCEARHGLRRFDDNRWSARFHNLAKDCGQSASYDDIHNLDIWSK
jgi:hypothetical protein